MSRSRWTPFLSALGAGAAAWLAWRFLPRDWIGRCCGTGGDGREAARTAGAGTGEARSSAPPRPARPQAVPSGSVGARVVEPAGGETAADGPDAAAAQAPGATQAEDPARCAAVTQSGTRCSRDAEPGSTHCWQHGG